jgi:hypothetical protein
MSKLQLFIPTRGRVGSQLTLQKMPPAWRLRTTIVCPKDEIAAHRKNWPTCKVKAQPEPNMTIAAKRAWLLRDCGAAKIDKIMMLDDDLRFAIRPRTISKFKGFEAEGSRGTGNTEWGRLYRKLDGIHKVVQCKDADPAVGKIFERMEYMLDHYKHGGINTRLQQQEFGCEFALNKRVQYALAFHVPTVLANCKLGRIEHREDFDYTLQLLRRGFENAVYCWAVVEQREYGAAGGASLERRMSASNKDAHKLARLHPDLVKVTTKDYKKSTPRNEVIVYWQKAIEEGRNEFI